MSMAKRIEDVLPEVIVRPQRLSPSDLKLVRSKRGDGNRLGFAILLLHFRTHGRFPHAESELDPELFADVMAQLGIASLLLPLMVTDRTAERHRAEIRELLGFREATVADADGVTEWLRDHAVADTRDICQLTALLEDRCRVLRIEPPAPDRVERIVRGALSAYDAWFCDTVHARLSATTRIRLDALLRPAATESQQADGTAAAQLMSLRSDPGGPSVNSLQTEMAKLDIIRKLELPTDLFEHVKPHEIERYRQRVAVEAPYELRRHAEPFRLTALAAFAHLRGRSLIDGLVDLLIETIHCCRLRGP
jgi:hypothetical protein